MAVAVVDVQVKGGNAVNQLRQINSASKAAQGGINSLRNAVTGLVGAIGLVSAAKFVFVKTAELETQTRSLQVLTGSVKEAKGIIEELQKVGAVTPFTSAELIETAKRLKAFGFETENLVEVTKRLSDVAGATGADLSGIATAFGQIQAKGRLQGEELLQLQERGVDLAGTLRKEYNLTADEFQKALESGRVGADAVNFALEKLTEAGGKYANGAIAQSDTLAGKFSTLVDGVENIARVIGTVLSPAIKAILDQAIGAINSVNQLINIGRRAQQFGLTQQQRTKILRQAEEEAKELAIIRGGGKLDPAVFNQLKLQREKDLIETYGFKTGQLQPEIKAPTTAVGALPPALLAARSGAGKAGQERKSQLADILAANDLFRSQQGILAQIANAEQQRDTAQVLRLERDQRNLEILNQQSSILRDQTLPADEKQAKLKGIQDQLAASTAQYNREIAEFQRQAVESLPGYISDLSSAAAGYSSVLDYSQRLTEEQIKQKELAQGIANVVGQNMASAFDALIQGTESFGNSLRKIASGVLIDIARQLLQIYVINQAINAISGLFGGGGGGFLPGVKFNSSAFNMPQLAGALANGGPAMAGRSYLVGEKGPEIFTPNKSGTVIPNGAMGTSNIVVNVDASGSSVEGDAKQQKALGAAIGAAVQAELIKQKKPGGLLY